MTTENAGARDALTELAARERAERVSDTSYRISLQLAKGDETYTGQVTIRFKLSSKGGTFLDFTGGEIASLRVNGREVPPDPTPHRINLPEALLADDNEVEVSYRNRFDNNGVGFHRFVDPEDGETYLYSDFEPYNAHRLFPCFDQPDLKATYDLDVTAPAAWEVVSNGREIERSTEGAGVRRRFAVLEPFSTYLFAVVAGPYVCVRDQSGDVDLGIYCRKSLRPFLDPQEIFEITRQGFRFYADYFGCAYPFGKYDQLFVPEFNSGAMENVGAVTFNESQIFRDPPTENQRLTRAEVILHELAHMWFGNLVTMRWWDGLWLNESFATYISFLAMAEATRFETCWENFLGTIKAWAYREDQKPSTHPIACSVDDTEQTFLNFDGITYGKGAAVLKQLHATVGPDGFREGLRTYFARHAWGNTELSDFLAAIEAGSGRELDAWARLWLETSGVNTLRPERQGDAVWVAQEEGNGDGVLRPHHVEVAALDREGEALAVTDARPVQIEGASTAARGVRADAGVIWCNHRDHAYARVFLDPSSLETVRRDLGKVRDPLLRLSLWNTLWEMVRDAALPPADWIDLVASTLPTETGTELVETILRNTDLVLHRYLAPARVTDAGTQLFETAVGAVSAADAGSDRQLIWGRALIGFCTAPSLAERLCAWLDAPAPGELPIDQGMRWRIVTRARAFDLDDAESLLAREAERDNSDRGVKSRFSAEVARPTADAKAAAFERFATVGSDSADLLKHGMRTFWWAHQRELTAPFAKRYFTALPGVLAAQDLEYVARGFSRLLYPHMVASDENLARGQALLDSLGEDQSVLRRILLEENDEMRRVLRLRDA